MFPKNGYNWEIVAYQHVLEWFVFVAFLYIACAYKVNNFFLFPPPPLDYWGYPELKCCMPTTLVEIEKL